MRAYPPSHRWTAPLATLLLTVLVTGCIEGRLTDADDNDSPPTDTETSSPEDGSSPPDRADSLRDDTASLSDTDVPPSDDTATTSDTHGPDPCDGVTCSDVGTCIADGGEARCDCPNGYKASGTDCLPDGPTDCSQVNCPGKCNRCEIVNGIAKCTCPDGYRRTAGGECEIEGSPCDDVTCESGEACVPGHHCRIDPTCVPTCDCSNCGNCDASDFSGYTEACGNPDGNTPTKECNDPCPDGQGCIPYDQPICWPAQGCFSK